MRIVKTEQLEYAAWTGRPEKSAWTSQTGQIERRGPPELDSADMAA